MLYPHKRGRYQREAKALWETLVPESGQADTVQGELIRCIVRLGSEAIRNGNCNWDKEFEMMATFLASHLGDGTFERHLTNQIQEDIALVIAAGNDPDNGAYVHEGDDAYTRLTDRVVEWCQKHPSPIPHTPNPDLRR
jgi:hypothetical protein